jgi:hypothetical protein
MRASFKKWQAWPGASDGAGLLFAAELYCRVRID